MMMPQPHCAMHYGAGWLRSRSALQWGIMEQGGEAMSEGSLELRS
jgi:hypothetical protein